MARKKLLAHRDWSGMGDWVLTMTVLKMVNKQFPHIDIFINLKAKDRFASVSYPTPLPDLVQEIVREFDVDIKGYTEYDYIPNSGEYDYVSGHIGYGRNGGNFIEEMVARFRKNTGLDLRYDNKVFAHYKEKGCGYDNTLCDLAPYFLIQACSKMKKLERFGKDYGFNNMVHIAERLGLYGNVIQVGQKSDYLIPDVDRFLSVDLDVLHRLMINSLCFVGMDGGLGVYASHHGVRNYIIYQDEDRFSWTNFPDRVQIDGQYKESGEVADIIINDMKGYDEKAVRENYCTVS